MNLILRYNQSRKKEEARLKSMAEKFNKDIKHAVHITMKSFNPSVGELAFDVNTKKYSIWMGDYWHEIGGSA